MININKLYNNKKQTLFNYINIFINNSITYKSNNEFKKFIKSFSTIISLIILKLRI